MKQAILQWWHGLSQRETVMVCGAGALLVLLLLWAALFGPLAQAVTRAQETHREAIDRNAVIRQRAAQIRRLSAQATRPNAVSTGRVALILTQDAAERGFTLTRNDAAGDNTATIAIGNARSAALLGWLTSLEERGLYAANLSIRPNADGTVSLTATMKRTQP